MKTPVIALSIMVLFGLAGCSNPVDNTVKDTGPVTITIANFDYHQTLRWPNGYAKEFYHCEWDGTLANKGDVVDIRYTGSGETMGGCANIVGVKVISHSPDSSELREQKEKDAKNLLAKAGYFDLNVTYQPDDNAAWAKSHDFKLCDVNWEGTRVKDKILVEGLICDGKISVTTVIG